jgi:uncharacterized membrane protein
MVVASVIPGTAIGVDDGVLVPLPSSPKRLLPQHMAVPSARTAHEWSPPALMVVASVMPVTVTAVDGEGVVVPTPSCPEALSPQHLAVPSASTDEDRRR